MNSVEGGWVIFFAAPSIIASHLIQKEKIKNKNVRYCVLHVSMK